MERAPASTLGIVAIDAFGTRREWHYGELVARSAGLSGAMAALGVERGDAVMTLVGSRIEWVLAMLACFRMGAVAMPCSPQLRRNDLEVRVQAANPKLCIGEEELLGELPGGIPAMTMADVADALDEDRPQETPADIVDLDPEDPAVIIFTSGTSGDPKGVLYPQRYLTGQRLQAEHWVGARDGGARLVHRGAGLVEVDSQRLHRTLAQRSRRAASRRAFRPGRAPRNRRAGGRQRSLSGADRVPDPRQANRAAAGPLAAPHGLRGRASQSGRDPGLPRGDGDRDRRRLRADRDGSRQRHAPGRRRSGA